MLFFPSFCNSKIWIAFFEQAIVNFLSIISPGLPSSSTSTAFIILSLEPLYWNQDPGFGYKAFIFAIMFFASVFHSIFDSFLSIFLAYVASLSTWSIKFSEFFSIKSGLYKGNSLRSIWCKSATENWYSTKHWVLIRIWKHYSCKFW